MNHMQLEWCKLDEMFLREKGLHQALIYYWDHLNVIHNAPLPPSQIETNQLVEGYWFGEKSVLHLFRTENQLQAVYLEESEGDEFIDERLFIDHRRKREWGAELLIRQYLEEDPDGQYHIAYVRPLKLIWEAENAEVMDHET